MDPYSGTFELVDPKAIVVDHAYQRDKKNSLIQAIAQAPSWEAFGAPVCFKRSNGMLYCADGQQRILGVLASEEPPLRVPVVWFPVNGGTSTEAAVFVRINEYRKALSAIEKHKGKIVAKDPAALGIERALETAGFSLHTANDASHNPRNIQAVAGVGVIYNRMGEDGLVQTLLVVRDAFPDDAMGVSTHILRGVAQVIEEQGDAYERQALTRALARTSPAQILRTADKFRFDFGGSKISNVRRAIKTLAKV
jgi:hypothetical protein